MSLKSCSRGKGIYPVPNSQFVVFTNALWKVGTFLHVPESFQQFQGLRSEKCEICKACAFVGTKKFWVSIHVSYFFTVNMAQRYHKSSSFYKNITFNYLVVLEQSVCLNNFSIVPDHF